MESYSGEFVYDNELLHFDHDMDIWHSLFKRNEGGIKKAAEKLSRLKKFSELNYLIIIIFFVSVKLPAFIL